MDVEPRGANALSIAVMLSLAFFVTFVLFVAMFWAGPA
jgi:hypothetical protein